MRNYLSLAWDKIKLSDVINLVHDDMPDMLLVIVRDHTQEPLLCSGVRVYGNDVFNFLTALNLSIRKRKNAEDRWEHWEALNEHGYFDEDVLQGILKRRGLNTDCPL